MSPLKELKLAPDAVALGTDLLAAHDKIESLTVQLAIAQAAIAQVLIWIDCGCDPSAKSIEGLRSVLTKSKGAA